MITLEKKIVEKFLVSTLKVKSSVKGLTAKMAGQGVHYGGAGRSMFNRMAALDEMPGHNQGQFKSYNLHLLLALALIT